MFSKCWQAKKFIVKTIIKNRENHLGKKNHPFGLWYYNHYDSFSCILDKQNFMVLQYFLNSWIIFKFFQISEIS